MPLDSDGYLQPGFRAAYLDGVSLEDILTGRSWDAPNGGPNLIPTAAQGHIEQYPFPGGTGPISKRPATGSLALQGTREEAEHAVGRAMLRVVEFWPDQAIAEEFIAIEGQTLFSLSRPHGYGVIPEVTISTHPCRAFLNRVEQTIVYGAAPEPGLGEVGIVTTARAQWKAIVTPVLSAADLLEVRFYPLCRVRVTLQGSHEEQGRVTYSLALEESLSGRWD